MRIISDSSSLKFHRLSSSIEMPLGVRQRAIGDKVITIGNFDGVHIGHQSLIANAVAQAKKLGVSPAVMLFEPQPLEFLSQSPPLRLMRLEEKILTMAEFGVKEFFIQPFGPAFASTSADDFAKRLVAIGVRAVVVGDDFRYGKKAEGDVASLLASGERLGFSVWQSPSVQYDGDRVSSSRIRLALAANDIPLVEDLLGHPLRFWGRVGYGDQLGRQLGFPTANIVHKRRQLPLGGVYSAITHLEGGRAIGSVCNIGTRPTVSGLQARFEVHLLDFNEKLYGQKIMVTLIDHLRDEEKFMDLGLLKAQITKDVEMARASLASSASLLDLPE